LLPCTQPDDLRLVFIQLQAVAAHPVTYPLNTAHDRPGTLVFEMGCFVVTEFLLTSVSRGPSAIAELLVSPVTVVYSDFLDDLVSTHCYDFSSYLPGGTCGTIYIPNCLVM